jgi:uncharacterized protein (DUF983 family)
VSRQRLTPGFPGLRCPHCGEAEALAVLVENLELRCTSCDERVTRAQVAALVETWGRLLQWIDAAQAVPDTVA